MEIESLVEYLGLQPHPEGGYYRETYRSQDIIAQSSLDSRYSQNRNCSTAIYYLLVGNDFSAFHRLKSDEIFHFYAGSPLIMEIINSQGKHQQVKLGTNWAEGEVCQLVINHGDWFASYVSQPDSYSLMGCTVSPGFDYADFELGNKQNLVKLFPQHQQIIDKLTR